MKCISRSIAILCTIVFGVVGCSKQSDTSVPDAPNAVKAAGEVNVYTHRHYPADQELYRTFTEKTGIKVNVVKAKADELIKKLQQDDKVEVSYPEFRPRERLVETASHKDNDAFLARNIVNRIWQRLTGRGIVDPPDQLHSENLPSHPELLDWLARDTVEHEYDLKRLIRGIVLSKSYSRSSEWNSAADPPSSHYFAVAIPRPLSPRQYAMSLLVATRNPPHWEQWLTKPSEDWKKERTGLENSTNSWDDTFEIPGENFQIAVDEALFFSNNDRIENDFLRDSGDRLVGHLKKLDDPQAAVSAAFAAVNSRPPTKDEKKVIVEYLDSRKDDSPAAIKQVVWALLTGPELRFNH